MANHSFSAEEMLRYSRQMNLKEVGISGQEKLKNARVLCIGLGGLGSSVLLYLAAAGVGRLGLVDGDVLELSNLHRQVLYRQSQIPSAKARSAFAQIQALNPHIQIDTYCESVTEHNVFQLISQYDIVVDCTDNFYTNYLIHDTCFLILKPYVYASISQFQGYCCFFKGGIGPCLRCLFPNPDPKLSPNCNENGVLGVVPGVLGTIQATEVLKWILGVGQLLENKLLIVDVLSMTFRQIQLSLNPSCSLCMEHLPLQQLYYPLKREPCLNVTNYAVSKKGMFELLKQPSVTLIDVRSVEEHKAYNLGGILIPLSQLSQRLHELNREHLIILYCQSSQRSIQALNMLIDSGFSSVKYLQGGISAVIGGQ